VQVCRGERTGKEGGGHNEKDMHMEGKYELRGVNSYRLKEGGELGGGGRNVPSRVGTRVGGSWVNGTMLGDIRDSGGGG